jgi:DNA-binding beta-propeller fold protein YncE
MVTPDGKADYVAYTGKDGAQFLRRVSLATGAAGRPIRLRADARQITAAPDGKTGYLVSYSPLRGRAKASSLPSWARLSVVVRPISLVTGAVGKPVLRGYGDATIAFTPDGTTAYVGFGYPGTVTPVTTATNIPGRPIRVPGAIQIVMTGNGATADVVGQGSARSLTVTPVATATGRPGKTITLGTWPDRQLVFTPDGKVVYDIIGGSSVTPVSIATGRAGRTIKMNGVGQAAITPDGKTLYVVNMIYPRVTPISTATNTPGKPIRMPGFPLYLAASPDGRTIYAYDAGYGTYATKHIVTPISTATNTTGTPITVKARGIAIVVAGSQGSP